MKKIEKNTIWFAVVNAFAASHKALAKWGDAERILKQYGVEYHGSRTGKGGNAMELTFDACMSGYRKFIAVGGDGTAHDVLGGIAAYVEWAAGNGLNVCFSDFVMGVIPIGSGNDWIRSTGVACDIRKAIEVISAGKTGCQDVVKVSLLDEGENEISRSYMLNVGGIGIDARVCQRVNYQKDHGKRGRILYATSLLHALRHRVPAGAKVICDGETVFDGRYLSMAFGVGKYSGGGMRQTPAAVLGDGLLDMTIIPDLPLMRIAREVLRLFNGTFLKVPELVTSQSKVITVVPADGMNEPVEVDGEVIGFGAVRFQVQDDQINIVIPE